MFIYHIEKYLTTPFIREKQMSCHLNQLEWLKFNYENIKYCQGTHRKLFGSIIVSYKIKYTFTV